ncbi:glycosyltransferase [Pseudalkalibacillus hwajinpoensis]|uniref:glycosyltransferase n=1 Tax=Guptibacillus hwajinpoensis TaxID=208199 RepID=UPI00325B43EB
MEKVSIIIPFYNCAYVDQAIKSAMSQTYKNIEVIVVNDGSTIHQEKIVPFLSEIRYIEKENGGTASALNAGIQAATGEYFSWLSSDDLYEPEKIEKQLNFMNQYQASVSYSSYILIDEKSKIKSDAIEVFFQNRNLFYRTLKRGCPINGCTVMLKMNIFNEVGLFDESLPYTQDYDLWLRVVQLYDFHYLNEPLVRYRVHDEMGTKKNALAIRKEIGLVKNRYRNAMIQLILREVDKT